MITFFNIISVKVKIKVINIYSKIFNLIEIHNKINIKVSK
jgi:hypothetical protein